MKILRISTDQGSLEISYQEQTDLDEVIVSMNGETITDAEQFIAIDDPSDVTELINWLTEFRDKMKSKNDKV